MIQLSHCGCPNLRREYVNTSTQHILFACFLAVVLGGGLFAEMSRSHAFWEIGCLHRVLCKVLHLAAGQHLTFLSKRILLIVYEFISLYESYCIMPRSVMFVFLLVYIYGLYLTQSVHLHRLETGEEEASAKLRRDASSRAARELRLR